MKNYFYTETDSPKRGYNKRITVYRINKGQPVQVGFGDFQSASWYGAHGEAQVIISQTENIHMTENTGHGRRLKGLLGFSEMYDKCTGPGIRLFGI